MKRAADERLRTLRVWHEHLRDHLQQLVDRGGFGEIHCACDRQPGRFRKGQRVHGCNNRFCSCKYDKRMGFPTHKRWRLEWLSNQDLREGLEASTRPGSGL